MIGTAACAQVGTHLPYLGLWDEGLWRDYGWRDCAGIWCVVMGPTAMRFIGIRKQHMARAQMRSAHHFHISITTGRFVLKFNVSLDTH